MLKTEFTLLLFGLCLLIGLSFNISDVYAQEFFADFGDAPDGEPTGYPNAVLVGGEIPAQVGLFPSLLSSDGARVLNPSIVTIGSTSSAESDALITNLDDDDGVTDFVILLNSIPPPAKMTININSQTSGTYYLNILIDLNMDGKWGEFGINGEPEWVVQNQIITLGPGKFSPDIDPFAFSDGNRIPDRTWMRIALTDSLVLGTNWDGTGEFNSGEIEDHFIELDLGNPKPKLTMNCPDKVFLEKGNVVGKKFNCTITNWVRDAAAGILTWTMGEVNLPPSRIVVTNTASTCPQQVPRVPILLPIFATCDFPLPGPVPRTAVLTFNAVAPPATNLPRTWGYSAQTPDPPSIITPYKITPGYGISEGTVEFHELTPSLNLPNTNLSPHSAYTLQGSGFSPNSTIQLSLGNHLIINTVIISDSKGSFVGNFKVLNLKWGQYPLTASDGFGIKSSIDVLVDGSHHCWFHK